MLKNVLYILYSALKTLLCIIYAAVHLEFTVSSNDCSFRIIQFRIKTIRQ